MDFPADHFRFGVSEAVGFARSHSGRAHSEMAGSGLVEAGGYRSRTSEVQLRWLHLHVKDHCEIMQWVSDSKRNQGRSLPLLTSMSQAYFDLVDSEGCRSRSSPVQLS